MVQVSACWNLNGRVFDLVRVVLIWDKF